MRTMKKITLQSLICACCFTLVVSCSKDVKAPVVTNTSAVKTTTTKTTTSTTAETPHTSGHSCGNHTGTTSGGY